MKEFQGVIRIRDEFIPLCTVKASDPEAARIAIAAELAKNKRRLGFLHLWCESGHLIVDCTKPIEEQFDISGIPNPWSQEIFHNTFQCSITVYLDNIGYLRLEPDLSNQGTANELDYTCEMRNFIYRWCAHNSRPCSEEELNRVLNLLTTPQQWKFTL